jgi:hypothetical protein
LGGGVGFEVWERYDQGMIMGGFSVVEGLAMEY